MMEKMNQGYELKTVSVRLVEDAPIFSDHELNNPQAVYDCIGDYIASFDREVVCIAYLNTRGQPIACSIVSMGSLAEAMAHPRELFKAAFLSNANSMIMVHNHPSGNLYPSKTDTIITDRLLQVCSLVSIPLVDHIIVGGRNKEYFSFKEKMLLENEYKKDFETDYGKLQFPNMSVAEPDETKIGDRKGR
ncbi:MAG: JAB domain-containing protein [Clostridium sp.]|nr:JAB domain-containing protein [Clostridium sp.]